SSISTSTLCARTACMLVRPCGTSARRTRLADSSLLLTMAARAGSRIAYRCTSDHKRHRSGDLCHGELVLLRYVLRTARVPRSGTAVSADTSPGEQDVLNLTARPRQGPPRSFFYFVRFPE